MNSIEIIDGKIGYTKNEVLFENFNLKIQKKEFLTILGKTGVGKSTILRVISGLLALQSGTLKVSGEMSLCFQDSRLFPNMTVYENIAYPLKVKNYNKDEIKSIVDSLIKDFRLENIKDRKPNNLSGGETKRVALARCIATKPKILLLDEPTSNLDFEVKIEVRELIKNIHKKYKCTTVMVTHDIFDSLYLSDNILILGDKKIIAYISNQNINKDKNAAEYFKPFIEELNILKNKL
ncbi:MAG: ABC transporter ATP-binding protein [Lachnospiraceae bacterium]|nr:ABC transporter ATP-binding protein [Lachnospiraceae bacterium]